jgi:uncharacterized membrane protein YedE/YeeE
MKSLTAFIVGVIFAVGLGIGGMTQTHVVKGFLDIFGDWNYALIGVMAGAITTHGIFYYFIKKRESPLLDVKFHLPIRHDLDKRLIVGAALFGLGWGWGGICPGPGIVGISSFDPRFFWFVGPMLAGMAIFKVVEKKIFG